MKYQMLLWSSLVLLAACSQESHHAKSHLMTVTRQTLTTPLFFTSKIQPLATVVVPSPADGVVLSKPFQYGTAVKKEQLLFVISSVKFLSDYKTALMAYIKAKNDFNINQTQLKEANFLYSHELISADDFKTKQTNFYAARLAMVEAKDALQILLHQLNIKNIDLYRLTIADIDKITEALHLQINSENLRLFAPTAGVILSPIKNEEDSKKILPGDVIKQGDVLAMIGDMQGFSLQIKVNELTINQLKIGQKVKVTGLAFPDQLNGEINRIDQQGETSNGSQPTFSVAALVPHLTEDQQARIHVGMSANVEIAMTDTPRIMIPIAALQEKNGEAYVDRYNEKLKRSEEQLVKTGKTTVDGVIILAGLTQGDRIVLPD